MALSMSDPKNMAGMLSRRRAKSPIDTHAGDLDVTPLGVTVVYTDPRPTLTAVSKVAYLARDLVPEIRLLVLQVVPYPLPLERPDVSLRLMAQTFVEFLAPLQLEVHVDIRLGRDRIAMLASSFTRKSMVVLGSGGRWGAMHERNIARFLRRLGHHVILEYL